MKKIKKTVVTLIAAAGVSCLAGAAACSSKSPDYYKLTFEGSGIDYILHDKLESFVSGGTVKKGVEVRFTVSVGSGAVGMPEVTKNGEKLTPDENGVYSFVMDGESAVSAQGVNLMRTLSFSKTESVPNESGDGYIEQERRIRYFDENDNEIKGDVKVENGSAFKFRLKKSVYYKDGFTVRSNFDVLTPDADGFYTVDNITANTTVSVIGLEEAEAFPNREGCGTGTQDDPYLLSEPIDLFYLAALTNSDFYAPNGYYAACYKLVKNIDMEGEQLYVVGDNSTTTAIFCGEFDGNGKTIENFYITDEVVDQESYENEHLPYVGLFGYAAAQNRKPAVIKDVTLKGGKLLLHTAAAKQQGQAGGLLLGFGIGVHVSGCNVSGEIIASSDDTYFAYTGGVAGIMQSAYSETTAQVISYDAVIANTSSDVDISATGGIYAAGGIVGYAITADESAISYVTGCTSEGNIYGGMHSGGIAGMISIYSSVTDCTAKGEVRSHNFLLDNRMNNEEYCWSYAGGIVGYAETDTAIAYCHAANSKVSAVADSGKEYALAGSVLGGGAKKGSDNISSLAPVVIACDGAGVALKPQAVKITVGGIVFEGEPVPMAQWYKSGKLDKYIGDFNARSWGYYFDEKLENKVPLGYVPTCDMTLYCGKADYSAVAGRYYIGATQSASGAYLTLSADGRAHFRYGGMSYTGEYTYDGNTVTLINSPIAALSYTVEQLDGARFSFEGTLSGGTLQLSGTVRTADASSGSSSNSKEEVSYFAVKAVDGFTYGEYSGMGVSFTFNEDGTGRYLKGAASETYRYTLDEDKVVINTSFGDVWEGDVSDGKVASVENTALAFVDNAVSRSDVCEGVWFLPGVRENIEITLYSMNENGGRFGAARIAYAGREIKSLDAEYDVQQSGAVKYVRIFVGDERYAYLALSSDNKVLNGIFYSMHYGQFYASASFYKYDKLAGTYEVDGGKYIFNGKGMYNVPAKAQVDNMQAMLAVRGTVMFVGAGNAATSGYYTVDEDGTGRMYLDGREYLISCNGEEIVLTDADSAEEITLTK